MKTHHRHLDAVRDDTESLSIETLHFDGPPAATSVVAYSWCVSSPARRAAATPDLG